MPVIHCCSFTDFVSPHKNIHGASVFIFIHRLPKDSTVFLGWLKIWLDKTGRFNWHSSFKMDVKGMYTSKAIAHISVRCSHGLMGKDSSRYLLRMGRDKTKEERQTVKDRDGRRKQRAPHWCVTAKAAAPGASACCRREAGRAGRAPLLLLLMRSPCCTAATATASPTSRSLPLQIHLWASARGS